MVSPGKNMSKGFFSLVLSFLILTLKNLYALRKFKKNAKLLGINHEVFRGVVWGVF